MAGLRERQKRARREAIVRAAAGLFAAKGYGATSMEEIAAAAGVSVPTVYAYVPSKGDLMVAIYESDRALVDDDKQALINAPPADPAGAIAAMLLIELRNGADYVDNAVWREAVATAIRSGGEYQAGLDRLNERVFDEPLRRLLRTLQRRGRLCDGLEIEAAVAVFSDLVMAVFHQQIGRDRPWTWVEERIRRHVATVLKGMLAG